jgi:hypothetical protein
MEEKKLTDEEIVKALKVVGKETLAFAYDKEQKQFKYVTAKEILDLIYRLQSENEELKSPKFASWKLKFFNLKEKFDKELVEHEEFTKKAKAEIERLTEWKDKLQDTKDELEQQLIDTGFKEYCEENKRLTKENAELQKQVDKLKAENTELYKEHTTLIAGSILQKNKQSKIQ